MLNWLFSGPKYLPFIKNRALFVRDSPAFWQEVEIEGHPFSPEGELIANFFSHVSPSSQRGWARMCEESPLSSLYKLCLLQVIWVWVSKCHHVSSGGEPDRIWFMLPEEIPCLTGTCVDVYGCILPVVTVQHWANKKALPGSWCQGVICWTALHTVRSRLILIPKIKTPRSLQSQCKWKKWFYSLLLWLSLLFQEGCIPARFASSQDVVSGQDQSVP